MEEDRASMIRARRVPEGACGATRKGTLGYQRCWEDAGHKGDHVPPDGQRFTDDDAEATR